MRRRHNYLFFGVLALFLVLALVGCDDEAAETTTTTTGDGVTPTTEAPMETPTVAIPFLADWQGSGHNDAAAEAFVHWNEDDPAVVPASCAKCHGTPGYRRLHRRRRYRSQRHGCREPSRLAARFSVRRVTTQPRWPWTAS